MQSSSVLTGRARSASEWSSKLAAFLRHGRDPDDPDVVECRRELAYHRVHRVVEAEVGRLSPAGVDRLVAELRGVSR